MNDVHALVADDHPLFRQALKQALNEVLGSQILEAHDYATALTCLQEQPQIDLLFLDLNMPGNVGLAGLSEIRSRFPNVSVLIVSAQEDPSLIAKALSIGASAFVPKSASLDHIKSAVHSVLNGEEWVPDDLSLPEHRQNAQEQQWIERLGQLTPHQLKVLSMLSDGLLNKQIAYDLDISESTVKQHVSAALRKLGVNNRTQAGVIFKQIMSVDMS